MTKNKSLTMPPPIANKCLILNTFLNILFCGHKKQLHNSHKNKLPESGRTMVEMLGVLAIMGVLSIGGIAGYTIAMNKYKANEILNEAQKRAALVAAQIAAGNEGEEDSDEDDVYWFDPAFEENNIFGAEFVSDVEHSKERLWIGLDRVPKEICQQMKAAVGGSNKIGIEGNCASSDTKGMDIVFREDMSDGVFAVSCTSSAQCAGCQECQNGRCTDVQSKCSAGSTCKNAKCICSDGRAACGTTCCSSDKICDLTTETCQQGGNCSSNSGCASSQFCYMSGAVSCNLTSFSCKSISDSKYKLTSVGIINGKQAYVTPNGASNWLTWHSIQNLCLANGKRMASLSDLGIDTKYSTCLEYRPACVNYYLEGETGHADFPCSTGYQTTACPPNVQNCSDSAKLRYCSVHWLVEGETCPSGVTLKDVCYQFGFTNRNLYEKLGQSGAWYWMADISPKGPCYPYELRLYRGGSAESTGGLGANITYYHPMSQTARGICVDP